MSSYITFLNIKLPNICDVLFYYSAVLLNIPFIILFGIILNLTGVLMYAYFANESCDPLADGAVTNGNQVIAHACEACMSSAEIDIKLNIGKCLKYRITRT